MDDIADSQDLDVRYWYLVINGKKQNHDKVQPIKVDTGQTVQSNSELGDAWYQYFKKLFSNHEDPNNGYDECEESEGQP